MSRAARVALALFAAVPATSAAPLFDPAGPPVRQVELQLADAAVLSLKERPREYVRASVRFDGQPALEAGIHLKGATGSFRPLGDRPSLTVDLDRFVAGQNLDGFTKLHLNNSVEDPSRLGEVLGSELFREAGLPGPWVSHARLRLNGRDLGLYVLKEGFTDAFLKREFPNLAGTLLEPAPGADVSGPFRVDARSPDVPVAADLDSLARACAETNPALRWQWLSESLDGPRFVSFVAAEVLLAHRDGYALARNNYRVFREAGSGRAVFLPHGMDQLFSAPQLPWQPTLAGTAAAAVLATEEGRQRYAARFQELLPQLLEVARLTNRVRELGGRLQPFLSVREWTEVRTESEALSRRIVERAASLRTQFGEVLTLTPAVGEEVRLDAWRPDLAPEGTVLELAASPDRRPSLHLRTGVATALGWRTRVELPPGRYSLGAEVMTRGVLPLPFGRNHGAALAVSGGTLRTAGLTDDLSWERVSLTFTNANPAQPVELRAELRARAGEAWFARDSLRLKRLP